MNEPLDPARDTPFDSPHDKPFDDAQGKPLLDVQHLSVTFGSPTPAVDDVSFSIARGETLGLVGESGSGKSVTAFSILRLLQPPGRITAGRVLFEGRDLLTLTEGEMRDVRGAGVSLIFQEPTTALNPVMRVGDQIAEALLVHGKASRADARARAVELLEAVKIAEPSQRVRDYPHQLSGGMRQRVMIAIALACRPPLVVADEPTTALDVTIQAQVLELLRELKARYNLALLLITHDFGVIAEMADRVAVMSRGRIVAHGPAEEVVGAGGRAPDRMREILEEAGYRVLEASDGEQALQLATAHPGPIHAILSDVVMPGMTGPETAERIRALYPEIRVLYMSGHAENPALESGPAAGDAPLLAKPFSPAALTARIREILDGSA